MGDNTITQRSQRLGLLDRATNAVGIGDVGVDEHRARTKLVGQRLAPVVGYVGDDHAEPFGVQAANGCFAQPASAASDDPDIIAAEALVGH